MLSILLNPSNININESFLYGLAARLKIDMKEAEFHANHLLIQRKGINRRSDFLYEKFIRYGIGPNDIVMI